MINALFYDCKYYPTTFDSCNFFAISMGILRQLGLKNIHLVLIGPEQREVPYERDYPYSTTLQKMYDTILTTSKMCSIISGVSIFASADDIPQDTFRSVIKGYVPGNQPPRLYDFKDIERIVSEAHISELNSLFLPVTKSSLEQFYDSIVLFPRKSEFNLRRNTPDRLFEDVVQLLEGSGIPAVIVPDLDSRNNSTFYSSIPGRIEIASVAKLSITWGGGISAPLWFSPSRILITGLMDDASPVDSAEMAARKGPTRYVQPSWFGSHKRFDWTENSEITSQHIYNRTLEMLEGISH